jgi:hypothetical protein
MSGVNVKESLFLKETNNNNIALHAKEIHHVWGNS